MIAGSMKHAFSALSLLLLATLCSASARQQSPADGSGHAVRAEARAVAYLAREVPAWRREHSCYSCHNNGDAARALMAASSIAPAARGALDDTLRWLAEPARWSSNGGGEGGADDKVLARIQFAHATTAAFAASLLPLTAVERAAEIVAADQHADGSWRLDASDSIGSPATYGTALATVAARRTILASRLPLADRIARAERWLSRLAIGNTPDAVAIAFAFADRDDGPDNWHRALEFIKKGQGRDGGWGPYLTSPSEPFDTALATLALAALSQRRAAPTFTSDARAVAIAAGRGYLLRQQLADGSWNETTRPAGQSSYAQRISTTGWALLALVETR